MFSKMKLRWPILPLDGGIEKESSDISVILDYMDIDSLSKQTNYLERMRYRPTPLFGMSYESYVHSGGLQTDFKVEDLRSYNLECYFTGRLAINPFISNDSNYYTVEKNNEISRIERAKLGNLINYAKRSKYISFEEFVDLLVNTNCDIDFMDREAVAIANEIIKAGFLIPEYEEIEEVNNSFKEGILFRPTSTKMTQICHVSNRDLNALSSFFSRLLPKRRISKYERLLEYFIDTYSISKIRFLELIKDKTFIRIAREVLEHSNDYQGGEDWFEYLLTRIDAFRLTQNREFVDLKTKEFDFFKSSDFSFDIVTTVITENEKTLFNLDNSKPIYKIFSLNADTEQLNNCYSLNYLSNDQTINFLLRNKYSNRINVNFYSSQTLGIELSDIYVTIDLSRNRFVVLDSSNQILNISTNSTLNINLLEEECQFLLMLSDINNIPFNYLPDFSHIFDYLPRVTVDNKLIIYREQFIIKYNSLLFNTVESLKSVILDYISNSVAKSFCYVREDVEVFINCLDNSNFKYLFKEIKKHKILHFKEAIQEKSFLFIDNKQYANEIVISLKRGEEQYEDYSDIPLLDKAQEIDILDDWVFFEIVLDNFIESILESMLELVEMNIKFFYIFYVNDIGEKVLRLRCKNVDNFPEILRILKKNNLRDFIIKPYIKESGRYFNMGIGNFEKFSCKDSIRILKTLSKNIDFDTLNESRIYELILKNTEYLFEYFKLSLIERYGILKDFIVGKEDRRKSDKVTRIMESDLGFINRFPIIENYGDSDHMSLIHMSNIRLVGNIPTLENEIYKYLALYYKKIIFNNGGDSRE